MLVSNLDAPLLLAFGWGGGTRSCFFEARETGTRGEGQLIGKILLLIRAITHCHNYQCHQRVCNGFLVASRDSRTPSVLHMLPITLPDWIYANWTKIKSHLRGEPSWDSFALTNTDTHTHTQADITQYVFLQLYHFGRLWESSTFATRSAAFSLSECKAAQEKKNDGFKVSLKNKNDRNGKKKSSLYFFCLLRWVLRCFFLGIRPL